MISKIFNYRLVCDHCNCKKNYSGINSFDGYPKNWRRGVFKNNNIHDLCSDCYKHYCSKKEELKEKNKFL